MGNLGKYLRIREFANIVSLSPKYVRDQLISQGIVRAYRSNNGKGQWLIPEIEIEKYIGDGFEKPKKISFDKNAAIERALTFTQRMIKQEKKEKLE